MSLIFQASGDTVSFIVSQLSFNGELMKEELSIVIATGGMENYKLAQSLDFAFMVLYATLIFTGIIQLARKFPDQSSWQVTGFWFAITGPIAAACDAVENTFILLMVQEPATFPDVYTVIHSLFALVKWILLAGSITWSLSAVIILRKLQATRTSEKK